MSFSLLVPLGLALSVLVAGPILAHMVRRRPRQTRRFGAMLLADKLDALIVKFEVGAECCITYVTALHPVSEK